MYIGEYAITSLESIDAFDHLTGAFLFTLDELQSATISQTEEKTDITGKQGRKIATLKRNKTASISGNSGMVSGGLLEMQTGGSFENKATEIMWNEVLTVKTNAVTTAFKAVGTTGKEIAGLYIRNSDGTQGAAYEQAATADTNKFAYAPGTKTISFKDKELADGTQVIVYYKRKVKADVLGNRSDVYSKKCMLYINALAEDKCGKIFRIQIIMPKADFSGEFDLEMGDNQTVQAFNADALAGGCAGSSNFWDFIVFGNDVADEA